jgi:hypothetical protein
MLLLLLKIQIRHSILELRFKKYKQAGMPQQATVWN